jgi:hypothetical protein
MKNVLVYLSFPRPNIKLIVVTLFGFCTAAIIAFLALQLAPFEFARSLADAISPDGIANSYTEQAHRKLINVLSLTSAFAAIGFLVFMILLTVYRGNGPALIAKLAVAFSIILLPFVVLYWLAPYVSIYTIGNDYPQYSIWEQMELMFSIKNLTFPLFVPGFEGGHSSSALTLGQLWHPLPYLSMLSPGYWDGFALEWVTFYRLLSLGLAQYLLFKFLRRLNLTNTSAFILSFIVIYNFRMLDLFRYGSSLEAFTGQLFLVTAIGNYFLDQKAKKIVLPIILATYWLVTSGHTQMIYLSLLSTVIFCLFTPMALQLVSGEKDTVQHSSWKFFQGVGASMIVGIVLASTYIIPFYFEVMLNNTQRVGNDYQWSLSYSQTPLDLLGSLFYPLDSDVHGSFGGSSLLVILLFCWLGAWPSSAHRNVMVLIWLTLIAIFCLSIGDATGLHLFYWKFFPFADSHRVPGRFTLLFFPLVILLLALMFNVRQSPYLETLRATLWRGGVIASTLGLGSYLIFVSFRHHFPFQGSVFSPTRLHGSVESHAITIPGWWSELVVVLGVISLALLSAYLLITNNRRIRTQLSRYKYIIGGMLCFVVISHVSLQLRYGTWISGKALTPTFEQLSESKQANALYAHYPLAPGIKHGLSHVDVLRYQQFFEAPPPLAKLFTKAEPASDIDSAYELIKQQPQSKRLVVVDSPTIQPDEEMNHGEESDGSSSISLIFNTFNRFDFHVTSTSGGWLVLGLPYSSGAWSAKASGESKRVRRVNGNLAGIFITPGEHTVSFRYKSKWITIGMIISVSMAIILGIIFLWPSGERQGRTKFKKAIVLLSISIYAMACIAAARSFHSGQSLETEFSALDGPQNITYND